MPADQQSFLKDVQLDRDMYVRQVPGQGSTRHH